MMTGRHDISILSEKSKANFWTERTGPADAVEAARQIAVLVHPFLRVQDSLKPRNGAKSSGDSTVVVRARNRLLDRRPDRDAIPGNPIMISSLCLSMIFSVNRFPLFRIML